MILRSPCGRCIVQPICREACDDRYIFQESYENIFNEIVTSHRLLVLINLVLYFVDNLLIVGCFALPVVVISVGLCVIMFILKRIGKTNKRRFEKEIRVFGFMNLIN